MTVGLKVFPIEVYYEKSNGFKGKCAVEVHAMKLEHAKKLAHIDFVRICNIVTEQITIIEIKEAA